jgi:hypothetical protein
MTIPNRDGSPEDYNKGLYRCLRCHDFPMLKPAYEHGCKSFLGPNLGDQPAEAVIYAIKNPETLVSKELQAGNRWGIDQWKSLKGTTVEFLKYDNEADNGKEANPQLLTVEVKPLKWSKKVRKEHYPPFSTTRTGKTINYPDVIEIIKVLDTIWKTVVRTGKLVLPEKQFGKEIIIDSKHAVTEHLKNRRTRDIKLWLFRKVI